MTESLVFMMGEYRAEFPTDRFYAPNHMWGLACGENRWRFGFTSYAVRLLQDVYFLDWLVEESASLVGGQEIGAIESKKAESALYAPLPGQLVLLNSRLMTDPSTINVDRYGEGWLFELQVNDSSSLLNAQDYVAHLDGVWEKTQRTIKGQMNE